MNRFIHESVPSFAEPPQRTDGFALLSVCHMKMEASRQVPCSRAQQASLPSALTLVLSAKQGSCEYHFLKVFWYDSISEINSKLSECEADTNHHAIASVSVAFIVSLMDACYCCDFPSSSSGWRYGTNGNSGSCRQPD